MDRRRLLREWVGARQADLTLPATLLLYYFATVVNAKGELWPSWAAMQAQTGLSRATIARCLSVLQTTGILIRAGRLRQVVRWRIDFDKMLRDVADDPSHTETLPVSQGDLGSVTVAPLDDPTGLTLTPPPSHTETLPVSHMDPEVTIEDPEKIQVVVTADTDVQLGEQPLKKENRKPKTATPFNPGSYVTKAAILKKENKIGLANYWRDLVHENNGYDGIPVDLTVKDREMLFSVALKLDFDWDIVRPLMRHTIEKWSYFRMDVSTQAGGKIGTSPKVGAFVQHLDIALSEWQSIATTLPFEVLQIPTEPTKIVDKPKPTSATGMSKEAEDEVLQLIKDMKK